MSAPAELPTSVVPRLVLASGSPRRRLLLAAAGFEFAVVPPHVPELIRDGEPAVDMVRRLARAKAEAVAAGFTSEACVLGCDTTVILDGDILGKPASEREAVAMLLRLSAQAHDVITGFALVDLRSDEVEIGDATSRVTMRPITPGEATAYAASGEPLDKAGAYALQGDGSRFVASVSGSRSNVIGLPLESVVPLLLQRGLPRRPVNPVTP